MVFRIGMWNSRHPPPPWKKNILNFHFDYLNTRLTCSAGRMRFSRIIPSSIGQEHIPTSEGRQPLLQPIFTPGIRCLRIHCGSVMVSKFTTLWLSGVPCLALSHYRLTIFPRVKTGWMLLPTIVMRYTWLTIFLCNTYFTLTRFGFIVVTLWHYRTFLVQSSTTVLWKNLSLICGT